jgi:hypothetical protein
MTKKATLCVYRASDVVLVPPPPKKPYPSSQGFTSPKKPPPDALHISPCTRPAGVCATSCINVAHSEPGEISGSSSGRPGAHPPSARRVSRPPTFLQVGLSLYLPPPYFRAPLSPSLSLSEVSHSPCSVDLVSLSVSSLLLSLLLSGIF